MSTGRSVFSRSPPPRTFSTTPERKLRCSLSFSKEATDWYMQMSDQLEHMKTACAPICSHFSSHTEVESTTRRSSVAWTAHVEGRLAHIASLSHCIPTDTNTLSAAHRVALVELEEATRAVQAIRYAINDFVPACRLPVEVLTHIFAHLQEVDRPGTAGLRKTTNATSIGWPCVLHVCQRWRQAAEGCSELWISIEPSLGLDWTKRFCALSHPR